MEKAFQEAKSALAFSQSLRDRLNQPEQFEEPVMEEPMAEESIQEDMETNPMEEKLEIMDEKLDTLLEMEETEPKEENIEGEMTEEKPKEKI